MTYNWNCVPPAAFAIGFGFGVLEVGSVIAGRDYLSGRKMETGERIQRGIFGALDMLQGVVVIAKQFEYGRKLLNTLGNLKNKSLGFLDDVFNKQKTSLSRGEYLRQKYNIYLTPEELNYRIELRQYVHDEAERLTMGLSKNQIKKQVGPAVAGVYDPITKKFYIGVNHWNGSKPDDLVEILDIRIKNIPNTINQSYIRTSGSGSHAEVYALNKALLEREKLGLAQNIDDLYLYVVNIYSTSKNPARFMPIHRCPHCDFITKGSKYFPEVLKYDKITK